MIEELRGRPRSYVEMRFAVSLLPCAGCGTRGEADVEVVGDTRRPILSWTCPGCGALRQYRFRFWGQPNPWHVSPGPMQLGGPDPSQLIPLARFVAEVDQLTPSVIWEPEGLDAPQWRTSYATVVRILTCVNELAKFGDPAMPPADLATRYADLLTRYQADAPRIWAIEAITNPPPPPPRGDLSEHTIWMHEQWLRRGRTGDGRLDIAHIDKYIHRMSAARLDGCRMQSVTIEGVDVSYTSFDDAELIDLRAAGANLRSCSFVETTLTGCDFRRADLALAKLDRAVVAGGTWDGARLDRALLAGARLSDVSLRDVTIAHARLDGATFTGCDLRDADLSLHKDLLGTNRGTHFRQCDLRGTRWTGRNRHEATFTDCQL